jgi:hypothetical protein
MQEKSLKKIDERIQRVKDRLAALGPMRPGTLSRQFHKPHERQGAFWQISYTHRMKSRSEYARPNEVAEARREIAAFRRFKKLTADWVELALERSQRRVQLARANSNLEAKRARNRPKPASAAHNPTNIPDSI